MICLKSMVSAQAVSNAVSVTDTFRIRLDNRYFFTATSIIPGSEKIFLRGRYLTGTDYSISYGQGMLQLSDSLPYSVYDTIIMNYLSYRLSFRKEYFNRKLMYAAFENDKDTMLKAGRQSPAFSSESIFGKNMQKSGTLIRGFTIGSNRDMTVQSGFRMQLSGKLSDDIDLVAALTDENSPIQPEGNTERLDELDKVFIQIKHKNAAGTFGEYDFNRKQGEFGNINRKLQGLLGEFNYEKTSGFISYATSRGKFNTATLTGTDAVQGPYLLYGRNNEKDIIVIAGSERVYLNGELQKRGDQNDYTIDYGNAQLTFTQKRLITSTSRIFVEFEYTDRQFTRNFFGAGVSTSLSDDMLKMQFQYFRDGDDQDSPIDITLTDQDREKLKKAGDNRRLAVKSGVSLAALDSLNERHGIYERVDSVKDSQTITFYRYNPGTRNAIYNVLFTYVGEKSGQYLRTAPGNFYYAGAGAGNYDTVQFLPMPELKQFASLVLSVRLMKNLTVDLETALSSADLNRFSSLDDGNNNGLAGSFSMRYQPVELSIGGLRLGKLGGSWKERLIQDRFSSLERIGDVEFSRSYNFNSNSVGGNEHLREISLQYIPVKEITSSVLYGALKKGNNFSSTRFQGAVTAGTEKGRTINYNIDYSDSRNLSLRTSWLKQYSDVKYLVGSFTPGIGFNHEVKHEKIGSSDSLTGNSLKIIELTPNMEFRPWNFFVINGGYILHEDYKAEAGKLEHEARSYGFNLGSEIRSGNFIQSTLNVSSLTKEYSSLFARKGSLNTQVVLIKSQSRINPLDQLSTDLLYSVSTQRSAKLNRVFVQVTKGYGNYRYVGDLNNNGVKDEYEFEPAAYDGDYSIITVPSDKLYPVIELKASARIRWNLNNIFNGASIMGTILEPLTFESYGRIEENSTEENIKKIYLLDMKYFMNQNTTLRGTNLFQQSVYLFENKPGFNIRLFYSQEKSLSQYGSGLESGFKKEQSLRIKFRMLEDISNQTDISHTEDNLNTEAGLIRNHKIIGDAITLDFSYRPYSFVETGFKIKSGKSTDNNPAVPTVINTNGQSIRIIVSFATRGRLNLEAERNELTANTTKNYLPFELTGGNGVGKNYYLRAVLEYKLADNLQSTASYDGRAISGGNLVHTARAELRAFF